MPSGEDAPDVIGLLQHWAHKQPDTVALRFGEQEWTWAQLLDRVRRLAAVLTRSGMGPKDRVAFLDKNHPAAVELVLAAAWIGAVTVTVNFRLAPAEIAYVLKDARGKARHRRTGVRNRPGRAGQPASDAGARQGL